MSKTLGEPWTKGETTGWRPGPGYRSPGKAALGPSTADYYRRKKRFTDAELAAEYWRLRLKVSATGNSDMKTQGHLCKNWRDAHYELDIMTRFLTNPHYDEETT